MFRGQMGNKCPSKSWINPLSSSSSSCIHHNLVHQTIMVQMLPILTCYISNCNHRTIPRLDRMAMACPLGFQENSRLGHLGCQAGRRYAGRELHGISCNRTGRIKLMGKILGVDSLAFRCAMVATTCSSPTVEIPRWWAIWTTCSHLCLSLKLVDTEASMAVKLLSHSWRINRQIVMQVPKEQHF